MAKKNLLGISVFKNETKRKRPQQHSKSYNKRVPNRSKNRGQGK
jgi:hypothetical protein